MIQFYPRHLELDAEHALHRIIDGRFAPALAQRRRDMDHSPLAVWLSGRPKHERRSPHRKGVRPGERSRLEKE